MAWDFVIIGSGVSGGTLAYQLTRAGAKCLLLEAGREYSKANFPDNELDSSSRLFWGGGIEVSTDGRVGLLRARCVGGTSIVNQALLDRFDAVAWGDWRERSGISWLNEAAMAPYYEEVASHLNISEIPERFWSRNTRIFIDAFERKHYGWKPLERAQGDCRLERGSDCMMCLGGCPRDSKQSSLVTTIRAAREIGLEVRSEFEVSEIVHAPGRIRVRGHQRGHATEVAAPKVVLAAGALGNTKVLLRSGLEKSLPALGRGFACHPQFMTYALYDEPIDAHKGAFQAVKSDDSTLRRRGFKLENVYAPPIGTAMLLPGTGRAHQRLMRKYRYMASMEVALRDEPAGRIRLGAGGKLLIDKPLTALDRERARDGLKLVRELFEAADAREIVSCPQTFGLHLMGGCAIGSDGSTSVVDPGFQVHGFPGLFAADSSVFPSAPGINPSFTIMALSVKAADAMLGKGGAR